MSTGAVQLLQKSLQDAHKSLEFSSNALKKLTGRDPAMPPHRSGPTPERRRSSGGGRMRAWSGDYDGPAVKRRDSVGGRSRLAGRLGPPVRRESGERGELQREERREEEEHRRQRSRRDSEGEDQEMDQESKPSLQSSVVATTAPPRPNTDPSDDGKSKMRNRRMFGFLMGTLQKFKDTEEALKSTEKEKTRKAIEKKLEESAAEEREAVAQEKRELYQQIKNQKIRVARIQKNLETVAEYEEWNEHSQKLLGYIQTWNKPPIFYLPAQHNSETTELLKKTTAKIEATMKERQSEINTMLSQDGAGEEGGGQEEGMDTAEEVPPVVAVASSVREGRSRARDGKREGRRSDGSESRDASDTD